MDTADQNLFRLLFHCVNPKALVKLFVLKFIYVKSKS